MSWLSRQYTDRWSLGDALSPFILYPSKHGLAALARIGINGFPWYVDLSLDFYLGRRMINRTDVDTINKYELIVLSVCYLTELYLESFRQFLSSGDHNGATHFVFHENLHDAAGFDVKNILLSLGLYFDPDLFNAFSAAETVAHKFGRSAIKLSMKKVNSYVSLQSVRNVLDNVSELYTATLDLNSSAFKCPISK